MRLIIWIRCILRGHSWTKTPIMVHAARIDLFNVQPAFDADGEPAAALAVLIGHELHHCQHCGRVQFSPWPSGGLV